MRKYKKKHKLTVILSFFIVCACIVVMLIPDDEESGNTAAEYTQGKEQDALEANSGNDGSTWTVMLYMCGSDLESENGCGTFNINQCLAAKKSDQVNVVLETGGCVEWQTEGISTEKLDRFVIEDGRLVLKDEQPLASMGESDTLSQFIIWAEKNYPADKYALILWDHGGGSVYGIMSDENYEKDSLDLNELSSALEGGNLKFELIGFDACLMATLETARVCADYGKYFVASEEYEAGWGWDYTAILNEIAGNPADNGADLGRVIVDSFYRQCELMETEDTATLSVVDLSEISKLYKAFIGLSVELLKITQEADRLQEVSQAVEKAENYGGNNLFEGYFNMVDIGDLANRTDKIFNTNSSVVKTALQNAVIYEKHGRSRSKASGLSVFYPLYVDDDIYNSYAQISDNKAYLEYISIVNDNWAGDDWESVWDGIMDIFSEGEGYNAGYEDDEIPEGFLDYLSGDEAGEDILQNLSQLVPVTSEDNDISFSQYMNDENKLHLDIVSGLDYVKSVAFSIFMEDEDTGEYYYLGTDNDLNGDYEEGFFEDNFNGSWISIGEYPVCAMLVEEGEGYNLYSVPAMVNGEETNIRIIYNYSTDRYKVLGTYSGMDKMEKMCSKDLTPLESGDSITFIFNILNVESDEDEAETAQGGSIVWNDKIKVEQLFLNDGSYIYMFEVNDLFGNCTYADPVEMVIQNGEIYVY